MFNLFTNYNNFNSNILKDNFIYTEEIVDGETKTHKLYHMSGDNNNINNTEKNITPGPSVSKLSCLISNTSNNKIEEKKCENHNSKNMYEFKTNIHDDNYDIIYDNIDNIKQYLFDIKRNGDHLQVLTTHYLNTLPRDNEYYIFCSIDRLAVHFARLLRIPCILINPSTGKLTLYKGSGNQIPGVFNEEAFIVKKYTDKFNLLKKRVDEYKK